jgi:hypothetical protein
VGSIFSAICDECGEGFRVRVGGGFTSHDFHCDQCGAHRSVQFSELGELHFRFLKGIDVPYSIATSKRDEWIREHYSGEPISESEYYSEAANMLPACECGGRFRIDAPPRCPKCRSARFKDDPSGFSLDYD